VIYYFRDAMSSSESSSFSSSMSSSVNSIVLGGPRIFGGGQRCCTLGVRFDEANSVQSIEGIHGRGKDEQKLWKRSEGEGDELSVLKGENPSFFLEFYHSTI
jgi:hypothetical protein